MKNFKRMQICAKFGVLEHTFNPLQGVKSGQSFVLEIFFA